MGTDFKCGCRCSAGHWFLCRIHEPKLIEMIEKDEITIKEIRFSLEQH